jgi:hypothetical protein
MEKEEQNNRRRNEETRKQSSAACHPCHLRMYLPNCPNPNPHDGDGMREDSSDMRWQRKIDRNRTTDKPTADIN